MAWWLLKRATVFQVINRIGTSRKGTVIGAYLCPTRPLEELGRDEAEVEVEPKIGHATPLGATVNEALL